MLSRNGGRLSLGDRRRRLRYVALGLLFLGMAAPARAQIYTWRDANGHMVLSNRPKGAIEGTYAVPQAPSVRATRPVASARSSEYDDLIAEHARTNSVRTDLVRAVVQVESAFNPRARSPKGAMGLMQLMPATAQQFGVRNAYNPEENVRAGVMYLRQLLDRYDNDEQLALAAYNAGPGAVDKYQQSVPPYRETRNYVTRINGLAARPVELRSDTMYKWTETLDGRQIRTYSNTKPQTGSYEIVVH